VRPQLDYRHPRPGRRAGALQTRESGACRRHQTTPPTHTQRPHAGPQGGGGRRRGGGDHGGQGGARQLQHGAVHRVHPPRGGGAGKRGAWGGRVGHVNHNTVPSIVYTHPEVGGAGGSWGAHGWPGGTAAGGRAPSASPPPQLLLRRPPWSRGQCLKPRPRRLPLDPPQVASVGITEEEAKAQGLNVSCHWGRKGGRTGLARNQPDAPPKTQDPTRQPTPALPHEPPPPPPPHPTPPHETPTPTPPLNLPPPSPPQIKVGKFSFMANSRARANNDTEGLVRGARGGRGRRAAQVRSAARGLGSSAFPLLP
jgi:hypothetical protein